MYSYYVHRRHEGTTRACSVMKNLVLIYVFYLLLLGLDGLGM
jgi:hypothetical protein